MTYFSRPLVPVVSMTLALAATALPLTHPASAEPTVVATATSIPQSLVPEQWCRPVVNAAIDPAPLTCWLTLAATEPGGHRATLAGMNLGDLPPWSDIDIEAIGVELDRYIQQIADEQSEAERLAAEEAARAAAARRTPRTAPSSPATSPTTGGASGESWGELPPPPSMPTPDVWVPEDTPQPEVDWDAAHEEHLRWIAEMDQRARDQLNAQCPGGGHAGWWSDGTIIVVCY